MIDLRSCHRLIRIYFIFCEATARCDGLRWICYVANTSQDVASLRKTHFAQVEIFQLLRKVTRCDAAQNRIIVENTRYVFLDIPYRSIVRASGPEGVPLSYPDIADKTPHKCTPYCVTTRTSQFSSKKLPKPFLSRIAGACRAAAVQVLYTPAW